MRIGIGITGASGTIYAQRLLDHIDCQQHDVHLVLSRYAKLVIAEELEGGLRIPEGVQEHPVKSMHASFASGSNPVDALVIVPCSMGTLGRIAHGVSEDVMLRTADVMLKENKKMILVVRETPYNLVHIRNMELLILAGATIMPASPHFYHRPSTLQALVDTVVARILDHLGMEHNVSSRWKADPEQ
ncbi:MAG: UbiX family flavin prenyltransferase [Verrucomicrobiota bacterium]|nr:UbiX family flavin prenyltransferase [Verrucomicrobiota bacterium]